MTAGRLASALARGAGLATWTWAGLVMAACGPGSPEAPAGGSAAAPLVGSAPAFVRRGGADPFPDTGPIAPAKVALRDLPRAADVRRPSRSTERRPSRRRRTRVTPEEADRLRQASLRIPAQANLQLASAGARDRAPAAPGLAGSWESLHVDDGLDITPPDPELAVGPDHVIAVVNASLEVYDKNGTTVVAPTLLDTFFSGVAGCSVTFDPNVLYDEKQDRFVVGADGGGDGYCIAASATGDPTGLWNRYSFDATPFPGDFFDFPHAGVGEQAIFVGGNVFAGLAFARGDVWAIDKAAIYAGDPLPMPVRQELFGTNPGTPQPMNAHGFAQGGWPEGDVHYILGEEDFDGTTVGVWRWRDPFGDDELTLEGTVDLDAATGIAGGFPVDVPQLGSAEQLQANDWATLDAEYRGGHLWTAQTVACNPGGGSVNCLRWAEIDPADAGGPSIVQAGTLASDGEHRFFPDLAVNSCGDMLIGYTKSSTAMFPGVWYSGRLAADPDGTLQPEVELRAGEDDYTGSGGAPHRWGDYTGATSDPDDDTLWYLGQYSRDTTNPFAQWGTFIGVAGTSCGPDIFADGFESGDTSAW